MTNSDVQSLTTNDSGHVTGVRYQQGGEGEVIELKAASVVLTTGGDVMRCVDYASLLFLDNA